MAEYIKPHVIAADDMAEGVFMASGSNRDVSYSLSEGNKDEWNHVYDYNMRFTNNSDKKVDSITVEVVCIGNVESISGNVTGKVMGNKAEITFNNYGNGIEANTTTNNVWVRVQGDAGCGIR